MNKGIKIVIIVVVILATSISAYAYYIYKSLEETVEKMQLEDNEEGIPKETPFLDKNDLKPVTFLLLGIGDRPTDPGRADSIIVLSVNPVDESILMFNIPRDTRMEIVGKGQEDKINHAYAYGGYNMVKDSVETFLDQSIDYVIQVNMNGFRQLVDALGGVEVNNSFAFSQEDELGNRTYHFEEGEIYLTGEEALHYVRMRKRDPRGDFGRNERQRQVVSELIKKGTSFSSLLKIQELLSVAEQNMKTNLSLSDMKFIFNHYRQIPYSFETVEISGYDLLENGIYYLQVSETERVRISELLNDHISRSHKAS